MKRHELPCEAKLRVTGKTVTALAYTKVGGVQCIRVRDTDNVERDYSINNVILKGKVRG